MMYLEIFTDFTCPWCYFCTGRIDRLKKNYDLTIQYVYFPLHPETPEEGQSLEELLKGRDLDIPKVQKMLKSVAKSEGLPFGDMEKAYNSRKAQELAKFAKDEGDDLVFHHLVFNAYFSEGLNIADKGVLEKLLKKAGLNAGKGMEALESGVYKEAVDGDWEMAAEEDVQVIPSFRTGENLLQGVHPYEKLARFMESAAA